MKEGAEVCTGGQCQYFKLADRALMYETNSTRQKGQENGKSGDEAIEEKQSNASAQKAQMTIVQIIKRRARKLTAQK